MENNILTIQVKEKNRIIEQMSLTMKQQQEQLFKLKDTILNMENRRLKEEVLSDSNPSVLEAYKKKIELKDTEIRRLKKRLRTYTIQEKKILVKEKAFDLERADYFKEMVNL